jgi:hypothetical protein
MTQTGFTCIFCPARGVHRPFNSLQGLHIHQQNKKTCRQAMKARLAVIQSNEPDYAQTQTAHTHHLDMDVDGPELHSPVVEGAEPDLWEDIAREDIDMEDPNAQAPADWDDTESELIC